MSPFRPSQLTSLERGFMKSAEQSTRRAQLRREMAQATGYSEITIYLLLFLSSWEKDGAQPKDLSKVLGVTDGSASRIINTVATTGLVTRHRDPQNAKIVIVKLNEQGHEALQTIHQQFAGYRLTNSERMLLLELPE